METNTNGLIDPDFARDADRAEVLEVYPNLRLMMVKELASVDARKYASAGLEPNLITLEGIRGRMWPFNVLSRIERGTYGADSLIAWR
ncbi:hypothetical protein [Caballeronia glebae]|jgi:hypothetical protein|uniref:hypothetical protein n=1 Tax=Caballeronia glebae TaxID=1777143 RepID=UPI0038BC03EE